MKQLKQTKSSSVPRSVRRQFKLKPEQVHKPAKSYDRKKEKIQLKNLLKNVR